MTEQELHPYVRWIADELRRPVLLGSDPAARERVMAAIRAEAPPRRSRGFGWLVRPRPLSLSPLGSFALAAGLVGIGVFVGLLTVNRDGRTLTGQPQAVAAKAQLPVHDTVRVIKFVLVAPQASNVALVGDFNSWDTTATPMQRTRTGGTWSVALKLPAGRHVYAFVVDGKQWVADPSAPLAPVDVYGVPNSVVVVGGASS